MSKILFVNGCPRKRGESRTLELCDDFIAKYLKQHPGDEVTELQLYEQGVHCYSAEEIERRNRLIAEKNYSDEMFCFAVQFAKADKIIVGAPYWDLSFPAILKAYVEAVCVNGITFHYTAQGPEGLAKFQTFLYITTSGGYPGEKDFGSQYMKGVAEFLGSGGYLCCSAEGLDIYGNDVERIMSETKKREMEDILERF